VGLPWIHSQWRNRFGQCVTPNLWLKIERCVKSGWSLYKLKAPFERHLPKIWVSTKPCWSNTSYSQFVIWLSRRIRTRAGTVFWLHPIVRAGQTNKIIVLGSTSRIVSEDLRVVPTIQLLPPGWSTDYRALQLLKPILLFSFCRRPDIIASGNPVRLLRYGCPDYASTLCMVWWPRIRVVNPLSREWLLVRGNQYSRQVEHRVCNSDSSWSRGECAFWLLIADFSGVRRVSALKPQYPPCH